MKKIFLAILIGSTIIAAQNQSADAEEKMTKKATFAGGCFWCMQPPYEGLDGILSVTVGYTGGHVPNPNYEQVSSGTTGHAEAVEVEYDPAKISYETLLDYFWKNINPTTSDRQFADIGTQYRPAIFYHDEEQKKAAIQSRDALEKSHKFKDRIVIEITKAGDFYPAEDYHQSYFRKNPLRYQMYSEGSGRKSFLKKIWTDKSK